MVLAQDDLGAYLVHNVPSLQVAGCGQDALASLGTLEEGGTHVEPLV